MTLEETLSSGDFISIVDIALKEEDICMQGIL